MLNRIKLTNFQKHRSLEVVFNGGLTALRGANEAGKSTLLRAICYALFGIKGLGATLEELVTWGEDVKTLRVVLELNIDGIVYSISRGKSGAEINYDGGTVTGQNEVTAFDCRLLKCDAVAATRLILANQNEIRGALEAGPAKTTELIERLAEFDQIDNLIETIQEKLTLGSTASVESAIQQSEIALDNARTAAVAPDLPMLDHYIETAQEGLARERVAEQVAQAAVEKASGALSDGKVSSQIRVAIDNEVSQCDEGIRRVESELEELRKTPAPDNVDVPALRRRIAVIEGMSALRSKYARVEPYLEKGGGRDGETFEGTIEDLEGEIDRQVAIDVEQTRVMQAAESDAKLLRQQITDGSCGFCGQDFSNVPEVKAKNAELEARATQKVRSAALAQVLMNEARQEAQVLREIRDASKPVFKALDVVGGAAELYDDGLLPPRLVWVGGELEEVTESADSLQKRIDEAERQQRAFERASAKIETLSEERTRLYRAREEAIERRAKGPGPVDLDSLRTAVEAARDALRPAQLAVQNAQTALTTAQRQKEEAVASYERAKSALLSAKQALLDRRAELDELEFNNALLKRVRACRPMIADQLWNLVLSAVSAYFSEMRGAKSRVRKGGDGFTVDGHPVGPATVSGSTLDVLGLAIRVALVRTFMPTAPFLILDEPAAACDDGRTNNLLGFLAGAGFKQVLLVTHEDISQAVADNVVTL
jgi:DNA repair exonuclease SbcCD ATPase subunit